MNAVKDFNKDVLWQCIEDSIYDDLGDSEPIKSIAGRLKESYYKSYFAILNAFEYSICYFIEYVKEFANDHVIIGYKDCLKFDYNTLVFSFVETTDFDKIATDKFNSIFIESIYSYAINSERIDNKTDYEMVTYGSILLKALYKYTNCMKINTKVTFLSFVAEKDYSGKSFISHYNGKYLIERINDVQEEIQKDILCLSLHMNERRFVSKFKGVKNGKLFEFKKCVSGSRTYNIITIDLKKIDYDPKTLRVKSNEIKMMHDNMCDPEFVNTALALVRCVFKNNKSYYKYECEDKSSWIEINGNGIVSYIETRVVVDGSSSQEFIIKKNIIKELKNGYNEEKFNEILPKYLKTDVKFAEECYNINPDSINSFGGSWMLYKMMVGKSKDFSDYRKVGNKHKDPKFLSKIIGSKKVSELTEREYLNVIPFIAELYNEEYILRTLGVGEFIAFFNKNNIPYYDSLQYRMFIKYFMLNHQDEIDDNAIRNSEGLVKNIINSCESNSIEIVTTGVYDDGTEYIGPLYYKIVKNNFYIKELYDEIKAKTKIGKKLIELKALSAQSIVDWHGNIYECNDDFYDFVSLQMADVVISNTAIIAEYNDVNVSSIAIRVVTDDVLFAPLYISVFSKHSEYSNLTRSISKIYEIHYAESAVNELDDIIDDFKDLKRAAIKDETCAIDLKRTAIKNEAHLNDLKRVDIKDETYLKLKRHRANVAYAEKRLAEAIKNGKGVKKSLDELNRLLHNI